MTDTNPKLLTFSDSFDFDAPDLTAGTLVTNLDEVQFSSNSTNTYSNVYVFGDSLVDTGNLFNVTSSLQDSEASLEIPIPVLPPSPPYFEGRFSNGQIWLDNLAAELGIDITPSSELSVVAPGSDILSPVTLIEGNPAISPFFNGSTGDSSVNFGYGLATTGATGSGELGAFVPGLESQVELYLGDLLQTNQTADPYALYIIWAGSNDYFLPDANPEVVVGNIETEIESLYDSGGRNFLVLNLPDLGIIPEANNPDLSTSPEELTGLSDTHNLLLDSTAEELKDTLTGADVQVLDVGSLFDEVVANPEEFGLTNVTEPFLDPLTFTPTAGANPDEYFFFDTLHPTAIGHSIISDFALDSLAVETDV